jgi:hypothetical protein
MKTFYLLSAELETNSDAVNAKLSCELSNKLSRYKSVLNGRKVTSAIGCYLGNMEKSFKFEGSKADFSLISAVAFADYGQESILMVSDNLEAYLRYYDGRKEYVGKWTEVSEETAVRNNCYTLINGRYFITIK